MQNLDQFIQEVDYAYHNVPFYQKKLNDLGINPSSIQTEQDVHNLPITEKLDYRKNFPKGVFAKGFFPKHPMLTSSRSSGSTGERLITIEIGMLLLQRALSCTKVNPHITEPFSRKGRKIIRYAAPNCSDVECANPNSSMEDRLLADGTLVLPVYHDLLTTSEKLVDRAIDEILTYQPDLFYVDPTHFAFLIRAFKKRNVVPPQVPVMTSYSTSTAVSKRQLQEYFPLNTHFAELLSCSEMGWVAMSCPHGNLHLNDDSFFFELITPDGHQAKCNEMAQLHISSIDQGAVPHLRYKTGDMVRWINKPCACGSKNKVIVMEGRLIYFISQKGQPVMSPRQVDDIVGAPAWLDMYQLEQLSDDKFILRMITNEGYSAGAENEIILAFQEALNKKVNIKISLVDYIATERSGKFQSVKGEGIHV